jgi:hypothetical protein
LKIKIVLLFFITIITSTASRTQSSDDAEINFAKQMTARFNFTGLADPYDANASLGAEYKFAAQWSAGSDVGYIFSSEYVADNKRTTGFIVRPFLRFYPNAERKIFLEMQLHYKYASYQLKDWLGKDVVDGVPSYEEYTTFHFIKKAMGIHFNVGTSANLSRNKKLRLEFYIGLGVRHKKQYADKGAYIRERGWFVDLYQPDYSTLVMPMGVRLVYDLKSFAGTSN